MCLYPKLIRNRKYTSTKKNGGNVPEITDDRVQFVPIACQKCMECVKKKAREWSIRLQEQLRTTNTGEFVTLTFSNEAIAEYTKEIKGLQGYDLDNEIATIAVRRFLERWRKKYGTSITHWFVTELGTGKNGHKGTENLHIHGIIFKNQYKHHSKLKHIAKQFLDEQKKDIEAIWNSGEIPNGYVFIGNYVNETTVNYCVKYCSKVDMIHKEYKPKILCSPGIGANYIKRFDAQLNKYIAGKTKETYTCRNGQKMSLPIYWRNQIYTEQEREKLWIEKLDKQERWVCGNKVSIKNGYAEYDGLLQHYRNKSKRLGYGDDAINWDRRRYENERRNLLIKKRINNLASWKIQENPASD